MSRTENTRPQSVLLDDPSVVRIFNRDHQDEPVILGAGAGTMVLGTRSKLARRYGEKSKRQHARITLQKARNLPRTDTDTIDISTIRQDKRSLGWRHKKAKDSDMSTKVATS